MAVCASPGDALFAPSREETLLPGLDSVRPGSVARVQECVGDGAVLQRLCEMGFVPGVLVRVVRYAPLGDPMEVELFGCHVSLRKSEAALLRVRVQVGRRDIAASEEPDLPPEDEVGALEPACPAS